MPVITGTIKPPRKRSDQIKILNTVKLSTNGIGMADKTAKRETKQHIYSAFGELYPPNLWIIEPPNTTPSIGAEMQVNA